MHYYQKIRILREEAEETQAQIAEILETTQSNYAKYEAGKREIPLWRLIKIAEHYKVSLDWICGRTNKRELLELYCYL